MTAPRRTLLGRLAAFGTRNSVRFAQWRARREAQRDPPPGRDHVFRSFIQVNFIRPR